MNKLCIDIYENSVPEGFADWVKSGESRNTAIDKRVQELLSGNELEEALNIFHDTLHRSLYNTSGATHLGNNRIH